MVAAAFWMLRKCGVFKCMVPLNQPKTEQNKNIIDFCGKPLIGWAIEQAKSLKFVEDVSNVLVD